MEECKLIALFGESGSGKDTILKKVMDYDEETGLHKFHKIVKYTSRPKRLGEIDGEDYIFRSPNIFPFEQMVATSTFNKDWYYGVNNNSFKNDKINIGVFDITTIEQLIENTNYKISPVRIKCKDEIRLTRAIKREEHPNCVEICRRFLADKEDFNNLTFNYWTMYNNNTQDLKLTVTDLYNFFD